MYRKSSLLFFALASLACGQKIGLLTGSETHPRWVWQNCTAPGNCINVNGRVVLDASYRDAYDDSDIPCYDEWGWEVCPSNDIAAQVCGLDGADYAGAYSIITSGFSLSMKFVTSSPWRNRKSSRVFLLERESTAEPRYQMFNLLDKEISFQVDSAQLGCGLGAALYFVGMDADGGKSRFPNNKAGARFGTGYCDSKCPRDVRWINGMGNCEQWEYNYYHDPGPEGWGPYGSCCPEVGVFEGNRIGTAFSLHPCRSQGQALCEGDGCEYPSPHHGEGAPGDGLCDEFGCDFNPYRLGNRWYYGPGAVVNSDQLVTVVTRFHTSAGQLSEVRRFYVQNGKVIPNANSTIAGIVGDSITEKYCEDKRNVFNEGHPMFSDFGGMAAMTAALAKGMVLTMKIDDFPAIGQIDSTFPPDLDPNAPGMRRGTCMPWTWDPNWPLTETSPDSTVFFKNFRYGPIGSTYP